MSGASQTCRFAAALCSIFVLSYPLVCHAQISTGRIEGRIEDHHGRPIRAADVEIRGYPGTFRLILTSGQDGRFVAVVPRGDYELRLNGLGGRPAGVVHLRVPALQTTPCLLTGDVQMSAAQRLERATESERGTDAGIVGLGHDEGVMPFAFSLPALLLAIDATSVTEPLDYRGVQNTRRWTQSQRTYSWTGATFRMGGMNATDSYQPGQTLLLPDLQAIDEVTVRSGTLMGTSRSFASETGVFMRQPFERWHGKLSSFGTGSPLASDNLPSLDTRGRVRQAQKFNWLTRDNLQTGGPLSTRADVFFSGTGQWSSQTIPTADPGQNQKETTLFGNARGRFQATSRDQLDGQYSGTSIRVPQWGQPAAVEALFGQRMAPPVGNEYGYRSVKESDRFQSFQMGWTRNVRMGSESGAMEVRYQFLAAHPGTSQDVANGQQSRIELLDGGVLGAAPLTNEAARTRHDLEAVFQPGSLRLFSLAHSVVIGGSAGWANMRNRFEAPSNLNLITAAGIPAYVIELNTPSDSHETTKSSSSYVVDRIRLGSFLIVELGVSGEFSRGSVPSEHIVAGATRSDADLIKWNNAAPRAGFGFSIPGVSRLVLRGSYERTFAPLAGRYLDFENPSSLGGLVYQWNDLNGDGAFEPNEQGQFLRRFGGPYSSISRSLKRPYADQIQVAAQARLPWNSAASITLYRRDEKNRVAAVNAGVGAQDYTPRVMVDPGPDSIPGTFDDRQLVVWDQSPSSFGRDQFLLTNPKDLRMLYSGFVAEAGTRHRNLDFHASFTAEKSYGPTNPGNGVLENDAGVVGALYQDPNTLINAAGRDFFDRAYIGKVQMLLHLPVRWGGFDLTNIADYLDGLVFARQLLVTGLDQGPFLVGATVRGSPEGGNRAEYVLNWNLQLSRAFQLRYGRIGLAVDLVNALNSNNRIRESDMTGPAFNRRLPVAIQPSRFVGIDLKFEF